jgi:spermidine/putrescine transport system substrate-binding protein
MFFSKAVWSALLLAVCQLAQGQKLTILNWEAYIADEVVERWQQLTGVEINQIYFDKGEIRDQILATLARQNIDIALVDETSARQFGAKGILFKQSNATISNLQYIPNHWRAQCGAYGVPYMWGTIGIVYRVDKVAKSPTSWHDLLHPPPEYSGHIGMLDDHVDMLLPSLILQGESISTDSTTALRKSFTELMQQAPHVLTYDYVITYLQTGSRPDQLYLAMAYSGDQAALNAFADKTAPWLYVIPEEGTLLWLDCIGVLTSSKNSDLAHQFINYLQRPEIAALNAQNLYAASPNSAALAIIDEAQKADSSLYPPQAVIDKSQFYTILEMKNVRLRKRITNAVRKYHQKLKI